MLYEYKVQITKDEDEHFVDVIVINVLRHGEEIVKYSGVKSSLQDLLRLAADFITDHQGRIGGSMSISRWANTQTTREITCPKCGALPGNACRTPKGRLTGMPHIERCLAYMRAIGRTEFDRRHSGFHGKVWDADIERAALSNAANKETTCQ